MIVAAAERRPYSADDPKRRPIEANFGQCGPHQRADKNQIAAVFRAKQLHRPADLADRYPVMAKALDPHGIAGPSECEQDRIDAARGERIRDRERHHAAARDQTDRR